jgi:hypothetical protein
MALTFKDELTSLINKHNLENASKTPDFILAQYLIECLQSYNLAIMLRNKWYEPLTNSETEIHEVK